jgi:hypothetical protein
MFMKIYLSNCDFFPDIKTLNLLRFARIVQGNRGQFRS